MTLISDPLGELLLRYNLRVNLVRSGSGGLVLHHLRLLEGHDNLRVENGHTLRATTVDRLSHEELLLLPCQLIYVGLAYAARHIEQ